MSGIPIAVMDLDCLLSGVMFIHLRIMIFLVCTTIRPAISSQCVFALAVVFDFATSSLCPLTHTILIPAMWISGLSISRFSLFDSWSLAI